MRLPTSTAIGWALCLQIAQCAPASNATSMQSSMGTIPTSMYNGTLSVNGTTPAVRLSNGSYFGYHLPSFNQEVFLGMTFAQPPTNSLRFAPPASLNSTWSGMRNATSYGFSCHSFGVDGDNNGQIESEDCLTINVVRPSGFTKQSLPVAVWVGMRVVHAANSRFTAEASMKASPQGTSTIFPILFSNLFLATRQSLVCL